MTNNLLLERIDTALFLFTIDRYFNVEGNTDVGMQFAYDLPEGEWNKAGIGHHTIGLMSKTAAAAMRQTLFPSYREWDFVDLDETTRHYITHTMAPLQWHEKLDGCDEEYMGHVHIWAENQPSIPPPPVPPTLAETLITGMGAVLLAGLMSDSPRRDDISRPRVDLATDETMLEDLKAFAAVTKRELPIGSDNWDLRRKMETILSDINWGRDKEAVMMVRQMAVSTEPGFGLWAEQCMKACRIPS